VEVESPDPAGASASGLLPRGDGHRGRASPSGRAGAVAAGCEHCRSRRLCHPRAISSGHERYVADTHGYLERAIGLGIGL
jgi:hypothetical protein